MDAVLAAAIEWDEIVGLVELVVAIGVFQAPEAFAFELVVLGVESDFVFTRFEEIVEFCFGGIGPIRVHSDLLVIDESGCAVVAGEVESYGFHLV